MRSVVITGASAGVGRATAIEFARYGWNVALIARGAQGLSGAQRDVERAGGKALVLKLDVADARAVDEAAARIIAEWSSIDVWINCAMVTVYSPVNDMSADEYRRVTEVTYLGYVHGTLAALRHMRQRNSGTIVQVGSALAYRAIPLQSAYCAAKFAVRGFTDALRSELIRERSGVRISMVQLPAVNTPQFDWARNKMPAKPQPVPPIFQPEVAARATFRAARDAPREIWLAGSSAKAIAGQMIAPRFLDMLLATKAYEGQLSEVPETAGRADNLFAPVDRDFGARGRFDNQASENAVAINPVVARNVIGAGVVALAAVLGYAFARDRK